MLIATFNVNSVRSRLGPVLDWLSAHRPDVLCLQETKVTDDLFPAVEFRAAGYHAAYRGEKSYNGVAVLSRQEPDEVAFGLGAGQPPDETRLAYVRIGGIHIVNTYVPQGRDLDHAMYAYKLKWFARLRKFFERRFTPALDVVWVGDLNIAPEAIDIHNAAQQANHVCYHVAARAAFAKTVAWGFVDVFRKHHPEAGQYTFFDYRQKGALSRNQGWRIDHILATRSLAARCSNAWIDLAPRRAEKSSDHTPLAAQFDG
jgi:exodeoxyribonuclease III